MDSIRFDALARALTTARSRRGAARLLGTVALVGPGLRDDGAATAKHKKRKRCPQKAAPHWCARFKTCVPACPFGAKFDPLTCICVCPSRTCCLSIGGSNPFCSGAYSGEDLCAEAIAERNPDSTEVFCGGLEETCACVDGGCRRSCQLFDYQCGGLNVCDGGAEFSCYQPLGGGPSRTGVPQIDATCGCRSHQDCVEHFGLGAFCAPFDPGSPYCHCNGASSLCVVPPAFIS